MKTLLDMADLLDAKAMAILISSGKLLSKEDGDTLVDPSKYKRLVGSFQYLTLIRPDITFGINQLYNVNGTL